MAIKGDYLIPKSYREEQLLALMKRLDGDFEFSESERSPLYMHVLLLVALPAAALLMYLNGQIEFPPARYHDWLWWLMIPGGVVGSLIIRTRRLDNLRFQDGILSFVDASGAVTRSVAVSNIVQIWILNREAVARVRIRTATGKIDFLVPDELIVAIQRDADDPFDTSRF